MKQSRSDYFDFYVAYRTLYKKIIHPPNVKFLCEVFKTEIRLKKKDRVLGRGINLSFNILVSRNSLFLSTQHRIT